jgi:hypothetical protein
MDVDLSAWGSNLLGNRFSSTVANETPVCANRCGLKYNLICDSSRRSGGHIFPVLVNEDLAFFAKKPLGSDQDRGILQRTSWMAPGFQGAAVKVK